MSETQQIQLNRVQLAAAIAGAAGLAVCGVGAFVAARQFFFSYLFGFLFWMGLTLGCFALAMLHHLVGGRWGFVIRRFLETGMTMLPLMALLFVPLLFGLDELYAWARPAAPGAEPLPESQRAYLNFSGFAVRMVFFFAVWLLFAFLLNRWSFQQDGTTDPKPTLRLRKLSGPGLVIHVLSATFAYVDWVMVLERQWYSTIFPIMVIIGQAMATLAFCILLLARFQNEKSFAEVLTTRHWHHLGNLLMAFMLLWTYMSYSQLLIIYTGNLPHEITWYVHRSSGGWIWVAAFLAVFHFAVPFAFLLLRASKRRAWSLTAIAGWLFGVHLVAVFWYVAPALHPLGLAVHWLDFAAPVGVGGTWLAVYLGLLKRRVLLPRNDPRFELSPAHG
jgi:hypothetical protein